MGCTRTVGCRVVLQIDTQSPETGGLPGEHVDLSFSGRGSAMTNYYFFFQHWILSTLCILLFMVFVVKTGLESFSCVTHLSMGRKDRN